MTSADRVDERTGWAEPMATSADLIRQHRDQVLAYTTGAAEGGRKLPDLTRSSLPAPMANLVEQYEAGHPGVRLQPLRFVSAGPSGQDFAAAADVPIPPESELVSLSVTESSVDAGHVEARCHIMLAARIRPGATGHHHDQ